MTTTTTAPTTVALAKIANHPRNPRRDVGDVTDLADSIKSMGILQPLVVAPWPTDSDAKKPRGAQWILLAGHRRLTAAKQAGLKEVPVTVRADIDTTAKQLEAMLVENLHRADLTPVEEAETYQALLDLEGLTQTALAAAVGQPKSRVSERLKLARLAPAVKEKVHGGQLTITDAIAIGSFSDDSKATKELIGAVGTSNFRWTLEQAERKRRAAAELEKKLKPYRDAGVAIAEHSTYDLPKGWKTAGQITGEQYMGSDDQAAWDKNAHADCPGRTVLVTGYGLQFACSDGKLHPKPVPKKSKAELKREAEDKARRDAYKPACEAATTVRRRHISEALAAAGAEHTKRARAILVEGILFPGQYASPKDITARYALVADLIGVDLSTEEHPDAQRLLLEASLSARLSIEALVFLADILANHKDAEVSLAKVPADGRPWFGYGHREWIRTLDDVYGYEWSDWERETFKVGDVLAPETAAADVEGGDDA